MDLRILILHTAKPVCRVNKLYPGKSGTVAVSLDVADICSILYSMSIFILSPFDTFVSPQQSISLKYFPNP